MPDLGHEVKDFKVYSWRLTNWRKLEKKITSPEFECGGHRWYVCAPTSTLEKVLGENEQCVSCAYAHVY